MAGWKLVADFDAHGKHAQAVAFSRDGKLLVSVGQDARVRLFAAGDFSPAGAFEGHTKSANTISFSPDGKRLATGSTDLTVRVWSFPGGKPLGVLRGRLSAAFSPDGRFLAAVSAKPLVALFDATSLEEKGDLPKLDTRLLALAFSPDGAVLLAGGTGPIHRVRVPGGEKLEPLKGHAVVVAAMKLSPDGKLLASSGGDGRVRLWSTKDWTEVRQMPAAGMGVLQLAFSGDGKSLALSVDRLIQVFDVASGTEAARIDVPLKGVYGVALSPDGKRLANAAADGHVRVWERG